MKLIKRITIDVFDNGESQIYEKQFTVIENKIQKETINNLIREVTTIRQSFKNYNIILFSKRSRLYTALEELRGKQINIIFMGEHFKGTVDKSIPRIQALKPLYEYGDKNHIDFQNGALLELLFNKFDNTITINLIKE
ncbi:hypothetical protein DWV13_05475 [Clostridium botulinum]|uniref:hypothetical protein n=1 Tax=Clostridium TaxID=1485 RepID=UPI0013F9080E|nr:MULTISPECIES: hypothetical protein [Clostridium]MCS6131095.1 hypothetical protein [Clostridium botulinum]NFL45357.1 hypothetical protein [Clostridium botulinum]NFL90425.1 hypothetical protein [Clostridium botulinum]